MKSTQSKTWQVHAAGVVGCLLLSAGAYFAAIRPVADAQLHSLAQRLELSGKREQARELDETLGRLQRELAQVKREMESKERELQSAGRINQRIAELTEMANAAGLRIQTIDPGKKHSDRMFDAVPIDLAGHASYRDHLLFLRELHTRFPDIAVAEFKIAGRPEDPTQPAQFKLRLCWFTARDSAVSAMVR